MDNTMQNSMEHNRMKDVMAAFISHTAKHLPDDVLARIRTLRAEEDDPRAIQIYDMMLGNLEMAQQLDRPTCQDTGALQFWIRCGAGFPLLAELESILTDAAADATETTPLRCNVVEPFDEYNTGNNLGTGVPTFWWDIVPDSDCCEIYTYLAGGGCSLPGQAQVFMPGQGYEAVAGFVLDRMTSYGLNACPPLFVGVGIGLSAETAALNAKKALMRQVGSHNSNERAAEMERLLEEGINAIGFGPQGLGGRNSVLGVNIEYTARHIATLAAAVTVGCWSHRRGCIVFDRDLKYTVRTHSGFVMKESDDIEGGAI